MYKTSNSSIALASIPAFAGIIFLRTNMTLGYVQAVIAMAATSEKLNDSKVEKNFETIVPYPLHPWPFRLYRG